MTNYSDFKEFELSGWEKRAETYLARTETLTEPIMANIVKQLKIEPGKKALDLASGPGYGASEMSLLGAEVLGIDFATSMVEIAKKRYRDIKFEQHDAEKLILESVSFDRVLCAFGNVAFCISGKSFI